MEFIVIDFETATQAHNSPCEVGLTFVRNNKIVKSKSWLIRPINNEYFDRNTQIHGIKPEDTANEREFPEVFKDISKALKNYLLVAHNASFDFTVLRRVLELYNIPHPSLRYICSLQLAKKVWKGRLSYCLTDLCEEHNIFVEHHHRACDDSEATAKLVIKAFEEMGISSEEDLQNKLGIVPKKWEEGEPLPMKKKSSSSTSKKETLFCADEFDTNEKSIFYGKEVVFTGKLYCVTRDEAGNIIRRIGGKVGRLVTKKTDFLVEGEQPARAKECGGTAKWRKAKELSEQGVPIEYLDEEGFLAYLQEDVLSA